MQVLYENYDEYLYNGLSGYVMKQSHKLMSKGNLNNSKVLEIGAGAKPHFCIYKGNFDDYTISNKEEILFSKIERYINKPRNLKIHSFNKDESYKELSDNKYSRIIASHVWEHVKNPEENFLSWSNLLDDRGNLSISIPCDPGFGWRLGQILKRKDQKKYLGLDNKSFDLQITREHVNPAHRLIRIAKYYYPNCKWHFYPFPFLPIIEFNLIAYTQLNKNDFIGN